MSSLRGLIVYAAESYSNSKKSMTTIINDESPSTSKISEEWSELSTEQKLQYMGKSKSSTTRSKILLNKGPNKKSNRSLTADTHRDEVFTKKSIICQMTADNLSRHSISPSNNACDVFPSLEISSKHGSYTAPSLRTEHIDKDKTKRKRQQAGNDIIKNIPLMKRLCAFHLVKQSNEIDIDDPFIRAHYDAEQVSKMNEEREDRNTKLLRTIGEHINPSIEYAQTTKTTKKTQL